MSLIRVDTLVIHRHAPPVLFVEAAVDGDALAELFAGGAGEQPPVEPTNHFGDPADWDEDRTEDRAVTLACEIVDGCREVTAINRRNAVRFDALVELVGSERAAEFLDIARDCAEANDDPESPFHGLGR